MSRAFVIVANSEAGSSDEAKVEAAQGALRAAGPVAVVACGSPDDLDKALGGLEGRTLVVAGGDGSLHLAVQRLQAIDPEELASTPIGLIPLGTGNDFARGLGLPLDPTEAAKRCLQGGSRRLDLLITDDGQVVVNASHAGLGALAAEQAEGLKPRLGPAAYPLGALIAGAGEAGDLTVTVDGQVLSQGPTLMVGIANGPFIGGGAALAPDAQPDDGLFDVVVSTAVAPMARIAFAAALRNGRHLERDDVLHRRGTRVRIAGDPVPHDMDGEVIQARRSLEYRVVPGAWQLLGG
ncbi:MAG: diacylglycerol kinase [Nitriliruptorales bacterium]|nr:diacylglycerol kinase [Nitriliruptorales bacterium]